MGATTGIAWTDRTWNPIRGCTRVSEGCRNCYAEAVAARFSSDLPRQVHAQPFAGFAETTPSGPRWTGRVELIPSKLAEPLGWRKPARVFVNSMSDLFHEALSDEAIDRVFAVMALAQSHTFQVLTKRPERMRRYLCDRVIDREPDRFGPSPRGDVVEGAAAAMLRDGDFAHGSIANHWPLRNVWLGVSVEDQATADERIQLLLSTPAAVRFVSAEPLLGPVDFLRWLQPFRDHDAMLNPEPRLSWVIIGGESGPHARPCKVQWIRRIADQCLQAGISCFVKQLGAHVLDRNDAGYDGDPDRPESWPEGTETSASASYQGAPCRVFLRDRKGGDPREWPADLAVRQFPAERRTEVLR